MLVPCPTFIVNGLPAFIVNDPVLLNIFAKRLIVDVWQGPKWPQVFNYFHKKVNLKGLS